MQAKSSTVAQPHLASSSSNSSGATGLSSSTAQAAAVKLRGQGGKLVKPVSPALAIRD